MKTSYKIDEIEKVKCTMTITTTIEDWCLIAECLNKDHRHDDLRKAVIEMVGRSKTEIFNQI